MSRLERLQIQGFRSFSPDDDQKQNIEFTRKDFNGDKLPSPLTLILGQNGCGKTTIIECLRYATTGNFPPGSYSGRNFVHDPKMSKVSNVNAHLKLIFVGNDHKRYIIARSVQAKQNPKQISVKTMDSTLSYKGSDGKMTSLSSKCSDINTEMARVLGVSDPILNYVIFCHQEDSNWPLDESSKVKQKFDEIFAAAKYNECLKQIKDERSKQQARARDDKKDLEHYGENKKVAKTKGRDLKKFDQQKQEIEEHLKGISDQLKPMEEELLKFREVERNFLGIKEDMAKAKANLDHCKSDILELRSTLDENVMPEKSEEEIQQMKVDIENEELSLNRKKKSFREDLRSAQGDVKDGNERVENMNSRMNECKIAKSKNADNQKELKSLLLKIGEHLDWPDLEEQDLSKAKVIEECGENLEETKNLNEDDRNKLKTDYEKKVNAALEKISNLEVQKAQLTQKIDMIKSSRSQKNKDLALTKRQLSELEGSSAKLIRLEKSLKEKDDALEKLKEKTDITQLDEDISSKSYRIQSLDKEVKSLRQELSSLANQRDLSSQLTMKKKDLEEKQKTMKRLMNKSSEDMETLFDGSKPKVGEMKNSFNKVEESTNTLKTDLDHKLMSSKNKLMIENENIQKMREKMSEGEKRIKRFEKELGSMNNIDSFDSDLESAKRIVEETREELQVKEANKHTFKQFIDKLEKSKTSDDSSCPTCNRGFGSKDECQEVISFLQDEIRKVPSRVKFIQKRLNEAIEKQERLTKLLPEKMACLSLREEQDKLNDNIEDSEAKVTKLTTEIKKIEEELERVGEKVTACNVIREDVLQIDSLNKDCINLKDQVKELEEQLGFDEDSRDYDEVKNEEELKTQELDALRDDLEALRSERSNYDSEVNRLQGQRNSIFNEKLQIEAQQQDRANMEDKKRQLEEQVRSDEREIQSLSSELSPLDEEISEARKKKDSTARERDRELRQLDTKLEAIRGFQKEFESLNGKVKSYASSRNEEKLASFEKDLSQVQEKLKEAQRRENEVNQELVKIESLLNTQETRMRTLNDNLKLKKKLTQKEGHEKEVLALREQMKKLDVDKAVKDKSIIVEQIDQLEKEQSEGKGRLGELLSRIRDLKEELEEDRLRLAHQRYKDKFIEYNCREAVIRDLNEVYKTVDVSIMKFHKNRMIAINKIIKELWRATYKGNDIDYIEIKTDEPDGNHAGADRRRNYSYRVVMMKNDSELEMRGRCSAGQKVLASLIIRLALAETFSANCGVIALDEPTTNLDRENIGSLAEALGDLVTNRANSNFQLIIITHDEDLLDSLGRVDQVDRYYKVFRNEQGNSVISKMSINEHR